MRDNDDLVSFVRMLADPQTFTVEEDLGFGFVKLRVTEAERRQALQDIRSVEDVVKELVRNSRDANASRIFIAFQKERDRWRHVTVIDDGKGIPAPLHRRIFEARVTSKAKDVERDVFGVHGRGMALYSIKHVAEEAVLVHSQEGRGTAIRVKLDTEKVPERRDQSTFPRVEETDGQGPEITGGPHNVLRHLVELVLEKPSLQVFLGSNAEVLSTLYQDSLDLLERGRAEGRRWPLWAELGRLKEGRRLREYAELRLGLTVSDRNSFRILDGEIPRLRSINEMVERGMPCLSLRKVRVAVETYRGREENLVRRIDREALGQILRGVDEILRGVCSRYFLQVLNLEVKRKKNRLIISAVVGEDGEGE